MTISHKQLNTTLYIALRGELDEHTAVSVRAQLDALIESSRMTKLVFELAGLDFMDSTGIGVLIGRYKKLKKMSVVAFVSSPTRQVDKLLTLSGIYDIMPKIS